MAKRYGMTASAQLRQLGAALEKREDAHGETKSGWWLDGVWLAPTNKPDDALRRINGN